MSENSAKEALPILSSSSSSAPLLSGATAGCSSVKTLSEQDLLRLQKPAQYLGDELGAVVKDDAEVKAHVALAFPDAYEVGMSHVGIQILYDIINKDTESWAERAYMPLPDMEALLREKQAPLTSLEAKRPLNEFDVVGFSLQYELCGTNILGMLELGGIPRRAKDRSEEDPIIIAGGPYTYHPEALAPFFDAFFLGDAEEFMPELLQTIKESKSSGRDSRKKLLEMLREIEGVYLPADFSDGYDEQGKFLGPQALIPGRTQITRRLLPSLEGAPFPERPIVPNINTIHNRLSVEVMRGCVRGCRFCQAGYLYRPQRERSPEEIVDIIQTALPQTGFEEVSLLSLSTADYCSVVPLLTSLMDKYGEGDKLAISFPSTRVDALTPEVLEQVQRVRRTGFTIAPEGGTQRLRDVINKGVSDEQILETCTNVFSMGWSGIKLYFMLGLPTETDEDLQGIIDIARRLRALPVANGKDITVSVSTHVPKPHTPFQWAEQITPEETIRRQRFLAAGLRKANVNFRYHDHFSSFLEGVFCRGGRELAAVIEAAYEMGCRLDGWKEHLNEEGWLAAFDSCGIDPQEYLRERDVEEPLPWDHLSCGISKDYFKKEYKRALRFRTTPDCLKTSCSICGACDYDISKNVLWPREEALTQLGLTNTKKRENAGQPRTLEEVQAERALQHEQAPAQRLRVKYGKFDSFRFLGHLETARVIHRAARRAELPICFSLGYHPLPRISFGPPLPLGIESSADFFDVSLFENMSPEAFIERFNEALPEQLRLLSAEELIGKTPSLQESFCSMQYQVTWLVPPRGLLAELENTLSSAQAEALKEQLLEVEIVRKGKKNKQARKRREKRFLLKNFLLSVEFLPQESEEVACSMVFTLLYDHTRACPNPIETLNAWSDLSIGEYRVVKLDTELKETEKCLKAQDIEEGSLQLSL